MIYTESVERRKMQRPNKQERAVGCFDSGFGGLTILREIQHLLPQENFIYLGDTANLPYGNKSPEMILRYSLECARFLMLQNIKLLIIACHTASSYALSILQKELDIPVIGVVEPGLEALRGVQSAAILATQSTIDSNIYQKNAPKGVTLFPQACPLFVPLIEEGFQDHEAAKLIAKTYLLSLQDKIDAALLACTHYSLMKATLQEVLGPRVLLLEPGQRCAQMVREELKARALLHLQNPNPSLQFFSTDDPQKFQRLGAIFWGSPIENVGKKTRFYEMIPR